MDTYSADKIKRYLNTDVVRKLLVQYFVSKGFTESLDRHLCPAIIQDLPIYLPILSNKIEIKPYAEEVNPMTGTAVIGWNLFALGMHRMYLGETYHNDLKTLAKQIREGMIIPEGYTRTRRQTTPKKVIAFITRVLGDHEAGYVDLTAPTTNVNQNVGGHSLMGMSSQFFNRIGGAK